MIAAIEAGKLGVDEGYFAASGDTPLYWAAILNNVELARFLLERGANVNWQAAKYLTTPLHAAARRGHSEMCLLLLQHGADVSIRERHGKTAGEWLSSSRCKAVHTLSQEVKDKIGFKEGTGVYKEEEPDLAFWGKYGPPPKLSPEEEAKALEEERAMWASLQKKS